MDQLILWLRGGTAALAGGILAVLNEAANDATPFQDLAALRNKAILGGGIALLFYLIRSPLKQPAQIEVTKER